MESKKIKQELLNLFGERRCELCYSTTFELLVAVILSAQCTDSRVNKITPKLFEVCSTPQQFCKIDTALLEQIIYSCGFYHNKAKILKKVSKNLIENYGGEVPNNLDELYRIMGRKTANVVYSTAFGGDVIAVDTHVFRVANRLGIAKSKNVLECEKKLQKYFDKSDWSLMHSLFVLFGRYNCKSKKPLCETCAFKSECEYYKAIQKVNKNIKN